MKVVYFVLPGQGIDLLKNGTAPLHDEQVAKTAQEVLGIDITRLTETQLRRTGFAQVYLVVRLIDRVLRLKTEQPQLFAPDVHQVYAGFSLGEISALACAGRLSVQDTLTIARERANAMQVACDQVSGVMVTLFGVENDDRIPCDIASKLYPGCRVIAGPESKLDNVNWTASGIASKAVKRKELSGAFHTKAMQGAAHAIQSLRHVVTSLPKEDHVDVFANVTGDLYNTTDDILDSLARQVVCTVEWERILKTIVNDTREEVVVVNVGFGDQLTSMLKHVQQSSTSSPFTTPNVLHVSLI